MEEVGRVSIRVVPDFRHFRKHLNRVLKQYDNRVLNWKVNVDGDGGTKLLKQLSANVEKTGKAAGKNLSKELNKAVAKSNKTGSVAPKVTLSTRYRDRVQADLNKMMSKLEVDLILQGYDDGQLRQKFDSDVAYIQKQLAKIKPEVNGPAFVAQAKMINSLISALTRDINNAPIGDIWDNASFRKGMIEANSTREAGLRKLAADVAELELQNSKAVGTLNNIDDAFNAAFGFQKQQALREYIYGFRDLEGGTGRLSNIMERNRMKGGLLGAMFGGTAAIVGAKEALGLVGKAEGSIKSLGTVLGKFMPSFGTGLNVAAYALIGALITPVLALASGLITAAPAALAAVAVPIAAIALGLDGIKKAAETAGPAFEKMRADISGVFEKGMLPGFENIRDNIIPGLTESFKGVAANLSTLFNGFSENLASQPNMDNMNNIIKNTGIAAQQALPGVRNFTNGILNLVSQLSNKFPGLSDAFNRTAESFVGWVDKITQIDASGTSQLDRAMRTLGETLSGLGGIISDLFANGFKNLSDPGFGSSMTSFVSDIRKLVSEVLPGLANAFQGIATALKPITATVETLSNLMDGLGGLVKIKTDGGNLVPLPEMSTLERAKFAWNSIFDKPAAMKQATDMMLAAGDAAATAATTAGTQASESYVQASLVALANNKEAQAEMLRAAFTPTGITEAVAAQITTQAQVAITGAQQAITPLKEGLQADINAALMPLGDIAGKIDSAFGGVAEKVSGALSQVPGIVTTTLNGVGPAADGAMKLLNDSIVAGSAIALLTAQTQAPLIVQPFKDMATGMAEVGAAMMTGLGQGIRDNVGIAKLAAEVAATEIKNAAKAAIRSNSPSKDFMDIGKDTQTGLAIGINDNAKGPVSAIREVMQAIKDVFGSAEGINLNFFMGQAASSMSSMAASSKEFRSNIVEAGTSPILSDGQDGSSLVRTEAEMQALAEEKAANALRIAELRAQKNATADKGAKAAIQSEIDALNIQQQRINLIKEEQKGNDKLTEQRKTAIQQLSDTIATNIQSMIQMPGDFAKSTISAASQDLGVSGSGAIPTIANWAMDAGTNFIFNVSNMDDALAGQRAQQNRQAAGVSGR